MPDHADKNKTAKGEFEEFKSSWLLQVAADKVSKAAAPAAMVLACQYLNRASGKAWPGINSLMAATGAASTNTIRSALKVLEERGHALIEWSDGGKNKTHIVIPLVNGKPFRKLKGMEDRNPSTFDRETLQETDAKPFKNLNPNHLKEPLDLQGAASAAPHVTDAKSNSDCMGSVSADADRPLSGREEPPSFVGEVEEQPDWLSQIPMPNSLDDYLGCGIAEDEFVGGQKSATSAEAFDDDADVPDVDDAELDPDQLAAWRSLDAGWADDADTEACGEKTNAT